MRTTFPNHSQLCHVWASGSQAHGTAGNMSFSDGILTSYYTPVARIVTAPNGERVALFTSRSYSNSTSKQLSRAHGAWRGNGPSFTVPSLGVSGGRHREPGDRYSRDVDHAANVAALVGRYRETLARYMRAQSRPYHKPEEWLADLRDDADSYCSRFGADDALVSAIDVSADVAAIEARFARLDARRADPRYQAKLAHSRETREARHAAKLAREQEERERKAAEDIARFRNGESVRAYLPLRYALLRVKPGTDDTLQTSQYAEVPLAHARRVYAVVRARRASASTYQRNGHSLHVGNFTVDSIDAEGNLRAGCHHIQWQEIERFAQSQGWE